MTEYDYSPEAYQHHLETQNRIARWVDNTEAHHNAFRAPFGARSDVGARDLDGMSEADAAIPSGGSACGWYEAKRGHEGGRSGYPSAPPPPPPPMLYHPQPTPVYPAALASAPPGYNYPPQGPYMSPPGSPQQIIIQTYPKHRSHHHHHHGSKRSSSSESRKSKSKTRTYIISPPPSAAPPMPSAYGYPSAPPAAAPSYPYGGGMTYPTAGYPSHSYSPTSTGQSMVSPQGSSGYYPQSSAPFVIIPPKGQNVRVMYA